MLNVFSLWPDAKALANQLGFALTQTDTITLAGSYQGRAVTIILRWVGTRRGHYQVSYQIGLAIPADIKLVAKEYDALLSFHNTPPHIPANQQTGQSMMEARFKLATTPTALLAPLRNSLDFCYSLLLFPLPALTIKEQQLACEQITTLALLPEITFTLEKLCRFAHEFEQVMASLPTQYNESIK